MKAFISHPLSSQKYNRRADILIIKNHAYNMTHTQNNIILSKVLMDGMLCINDGYSNVLVGGASEKEEDAIYNIKTRLR